MPSAQMRFLDQAKRSAEKLRSAGPLTSAGQLTPDGQLTSAMPGVVLASRYRHRQSSVEIGRSEVLPVLPEGTEDFLWGCERTAVVVISPEQYGAFLQVVTAVNGSIAAADEDGWKESWSGTLHQTHFWSDWLGGETTDVRRRDLDCGTRCEIRIIGPFVEKKWWPPGLPHSTTAPYTELVRVVGGGHAGALSALGR